MRIPAHIKDMKGSSVLLQISPTRFFNQIGNCRLQTRSDFFLHVRSLQIIISVLLPPPLPRFKRQIVAFLKKFHTVTTWKGA